MTNAAQPSEPENYVNEDGDYGCFKAV